MFFEKTATLVSTLRGPRCGPRANMMILLRFFNDFYGNHLKTLSKITISGGTARPVRVLTKTAFFLKKTLKTLSNINIFCIFCIFQFFKNWLYFKTLKTLSKITISGGTARPVRVLTKTSFFFKKHFKKQT